MSESTSTTVAVRPDRRLVSSHTSPWREGSAVTSEHYGLGAGLGGGGPVSVLGGGQSGELIIEETAAHGLGDVVAELVVGGDAQPRGEVVVHCDVHAHCHAHNNTVQRVFRRAADPWRGGSLL
jgi:hypothetical protein